MKSKLVLKVDDSKMTLDYSAFSPKSQFSETGVTSAVIEVFPAGLCWRLHLDSRNVASFLDKCGFTSPKVSSKPGNIIRVPVSSLVFVQVSARRARRKALSLVDKTGTLPGCGEVA